MHEKMAMRRPAENLGKWTVPDGDQYGWTWGIAQCSGYVLFDAERYHGDRAMRWYSKTGKTQARMATAAEIKKARSRKWRAVVEEELSRREPTMRLLGENRGIVFLD